MGIACSNSQFPVIDYTQIVLLIFSKTSSMPQFFDYFFFFMIFLVCDVTHCSSLNFQDQNVLINSVVVDLAAVWKFGGSGGWWFLLFDSLIDKVCMSVC